MTSQEARKEIDDLTKLAISFGAKALANIQYMVDGTVKYQIQKRRDKRDGFRMCRIYHSTAAA